MAKNTQLPFCPNCGSKGTLIQLNLNKINDGEWSIGVSYGGDTPEYFSVVEGCTCTACNKSILFQPVGTPLTKKEKKAPEKARQEALRVAPVDDVNLALLIKSFNCVWKLDKKQSRPALCKLYYVNALNWTGDSGCV